MRRRFTRVMPIVAAVFLFAAVGVCGEPPAKSDAKPQQAERERLWREGRKLEAKDNLDEAVKLYEEVLSLDRQSAGMKPEQLADTLRHLAVLQSCRDDMKAARQAAGECLQVQIGKLGADHWQVKSTRYLVDCIDRLAKCRPTCVTSGRSFSGRASG